MRKLRDSLEIIADILKAVSLKSSKTGIMEAANLNFYNVNSYVESALRDGLLLASNNKYEVTDRGKVFLEKYCELANTLNEVKNSLEELKEEKKALETELLDKSVSKDKEVEVLIEKKDAPLIMKLSFDRIDPDEFMVN